MGIAWCRELPRGRGVSQKSGQNGSLDTTMDRAFLVRCDALFTPEVDIASAPGISVGDQHPAFAALMCNEITAKPNDESGLLWTVDVKYSTPQIGGGGEEPGEGIPLPRDIWTAGGASKSVPVFQDTAGRLIVNAAGDVLEGLMKEQVEFTLNLTKAFATHTDWLNVAIACVDHTNAGGWNGTAAETWLCRFRSAQLETKMTKDACLIYWSTQWEFAYCETTWRLKPWNVGFHWIDNYGSGGPTRKPALCGDGKTPVKQPVALGSDGRILPIGSLPIVADDPDGGPGWRVYDTADFSVFGIVTTPSC